MIETIAAISTSQIPSAIGIIRVSGSETINVATKILKKNGQTLTSEFFEKNKRNAIYCEVYEKDKILDQVIAIWYKAPNSFTGEDLLEISLHGNPILLNSVLDLIFQLHVRPAEKGEFSKRAYLNGKISISEAEAIGRLISARSKFELELSQKNLTGEMSRLTSRIRSGMISLKSEYEAEIDFSTEDLTYESMEERKERIHAILNICKETLRKSEIANKIISTTKVVIYGAPNTGKSSLLNCIIGKDRAIISEIPGTTRDFISEQIYLEGIPIELVDTAGIRETSDTIEKAGIEKSEKEFSNANIRLFLIDTSCEIDWRKFLSDNKEKLTNSILVANKIDIRSPSYDQKIFLDQTHFDCIEISCKKRIGIDTLIQKITEKLKKNEPTEDYVLIEERIKHHISRIIFHLENTFELIQKNAPPEITVKEIDYAILETGKINGKIETEEILGRIFSKFCVGK
ncbi:MAG: tRNA uridine-5-carboxymethylaminomethyl(34) synthesis GTPase MnmE [Leptospiraceae bacterium]|nr:tRNA uridine-5-carboxymethylaminomethyl(34) synthesis GTPase MnmE [Leptospiraceae bacterium]MCK6380739.1 tRNA uridine-5-carboxymethylaminomethyl(34) synthesis GTPase MnmE [Leptospiraceae bacterium]NUM40282.1 tRNA uridine-5-carboxymethylaminomethyl(34) synthesis GTPase MnmE [Leptospiraceae bacterium]